MPYYPDALGGFAIGFAQNSAPPSISATVDTSIIPSFVGVKQIPANWFTTGRTARLVIAGTIDSAPILPTAVLKLKIGSQTITASAAALLAATTGATFELVARLQCVSPGTAGTVNVAGRANVVTGLNGMGAVGLNGQLTLDTTSALPLDVTVAFGQTGNTLKPYVAFLELPTG